MNNKPNFCGRTRREFFWETGAGFTGVALAGMLGNDGFLNSQAVAADGNIYFASEFGDVYVIKAGPDFEELAVNELDEIHMSTPAISDGVLFFRTRGHVVAIADLGS